MNLTFLTYGNKEPISINLILRKLFFNTVTSKDVNLHQSFRKRCLIALPELSLFLWNILLSLYWKIICKITVYVKFVYGMSMLHPRVITLISTFRIMLNFQPGWSMYSVYLYFIFAIYSYSVICKNTVIYSTTVTYCNILTSFYKVWSRLNHSEQSCSCTGWYM